MDSSNRNLPRVLWIADVFPRPHKITDGVWSFKTALSLQRKGLEVIVLSPTPWIPKWFGFTPQLKGWSNVPYADEIENVKVFYPKCPHYPKRFVRNSLYSYLPAFETSVVYHWIKDTVSFLMEKHPFHLMHANFMFPSGYIGFRTKKKYGIPLVFHEWGTRRLDRASKINGQKEIYSRVLRESDSVIVLNSKMADIITGKFHYKGKLSLVRAVGDGNVSDKLHERKPERYAGKKIVLSVGTLIERKGQEYLIRAVNKVKNDLPEIRCIIIGRGKKEKSIKELIERLGLGAFVELWGEVPNQEVLKTMSWCDVFALPSWDEAFGAVYGEAMSLGKPVIGCVGEGIGDVLQNGVQGFLVKRQDVDSLAEAITKVLTDESLAFRMGKEAKTLAEKELNYDFISSQIIDIYHDILS